MTIFMMLWLSGCDSDLGNKIIGDVKKTIEGEVVKQGSEIKKQIDQAINLGTGKSVQDEDSGAKEDSKNSSDAESVEEKD
jgi:hypothetical protein